MKIKYLLWDFDKTLAYRDGMWSSTLCDLLGENGYDDLNIEDVRSHLKNEFPWNSPEMSHEEFFKGKGWWEHINGRFAIVLKEFGVGDAIAERITGDFRERYLTLSKWRLYDDTVFCLDAAVGKGYTNVILSNHVPELEEMVKALGIRDYFAKVYTSALMGYEKPNRKIFEKALSELEDIESATMIGDNYTADVQGARNAGIDAILVRKSNDFGYEKYFPSLRELADFI